MEITLKNIQDTERLGNIISANLEKGSVLCLDGDLGAGKTTLTQFIAKGLNINEYVTSPTFTIIKEYQGKLPLYHMDVYRIESEDDMYDLGYEEYIYSDGITIIEWSVKIKNMLPSERVNINMQRGNDDCSRVLTISGKGRVYDRILKEVNCYENSCN